MQRRTSPVGIACFRYAPTRAIVRPLCLLPLDRWGLSTPAPGQVGSFHLRCESAHMENRRLLTRPSPSLPGRNSIPAPLSDPSPTCGFRLEFHSADRLRKTTPDRSYRAKFHVPLLARRSRPASNRRHRLSYLDPISPHQHLYRESQNQKDKRITI